MRGFIPITVIIAVLHFFEDAALVILGRYTEINIFILFIATILFSIVVVYVTKMPFVHKFFHQDKD